MPEPASSLSIFWPSELQSMSLRYACFRCLQFSFFPSFDGFVAFLDLTCLPFLLSHLIVEAKSASVVSVYLVKKECPLIPLDRPVGDDALVGDVPVWVLTSEVSRDGVTAGVISTATRIRARETDRNGCGGRAENSRNGRGRDGMRKNSRGRNKGLSSDGSGVLMIHQSWDSFRESGRACTGGGYLGVRPYRRRRERR